MDLLNSKSIGRTLKERRLQLGYTQELAAEKSGISYSYYTKIERGEQLPSIEICVQLAQGSVSPVRSWVCLMYTLSILAVLMPSRETGRKIPASGRCAPQSQPNI